ncbi:MAG: hypothetical protein B6D63_05215 [Candidatus Latescibacteria bacterium 4484_7]|nr:MAG: hypothetical protein B6D63_05215 [Candidatus Latescibacteria bacterium 4484_7]RKZ07926.1 MAG: hypothetical protein DRQ05_02360 [bacterium]
MAYSKLELKVGFTVFIAGLILIVGLMWFQGFKMEKDYYEIYAVFPQVGGINPGDKVNVNGVEKGTVKRVSLREKDVMVVMDIEKSMKLPEDSRIMLQTVGIMGARVVTIVMGKSTRMLEPGAVIQGRYDPGISEAIASLGSMMEELRSLTDNLEEIMGTFNENGRLRRTLDNLTEISTQLKSTIEVNAPKIDRSINSFQSSAQRVDSMLDKNSTMLDSIITSVNAASRDLPTLVKNIDAVTRNLNEITNGLKSDSTTAGAILSDREFLDKLERTLKNLDELLVDIKANPGRYMKVEIF